MAYLGYDGRKTTRFETTVTAANNQTVFYPHGGYTKGYVDVFVNGTKSAVGTDFYANNSLSIDFISPVTNGAIVQIVAFGPMSLAQSVARSGDAMSGTLTVPDVVVTSNLESNHILTQTLAVENTASFAYGANISGTLAQNGDVTVTGNLTLNGSLVITGNATSISTSTLTVEDTVVKLGSNNSTDSLDIGLAGQYSNGSANLFAGVIRDATDKKFYFFSGYANTPGNDIDTADPSFTIASVVGNFEGNVTSNTILVDTLNSGSINLTASLRLQGDASGIRQDTTSIYGGDAGAGYGRIEYHNNQWILNAGSDSNYITTFQRGNLVKSYINNDGNFTGTANNTTYFNGQLAAFYTNATNITTGTLSNNQLYNTGVVANTYGNSSVYPVITVDAKGRVTAINTAAGGIGGSNTQVIFNDSGSANGASDFTFNKTSKNLSVANNIISGAVRLNSNVLFYSTTLVTTNTSQQTLDSFTTAAHRVGKYILNIESGSDHHSLELNILHDSVDVFYSQFAEIKTNAVLGTFDASIASGTLSVLFTPTNSVTTVKAAVTLIPT